MLLFSFGLALLLGFVCFATYRTGQVLQSWKPDKNLLLNPAENIARLVMIGAAVGLGVLSGRGPAALGWVSGQPLADLLIGLAVGAAISLALLPLSLWVKRRHPQWQNDVVLESIRPRSRRQWPLVLLALIPVALLEELLFRSLLLGGLGSLVNVWWFALAASILFGLLHRPQGDWGVAAATAVSLVFSALFLWRVSLLLVTAAHWMANATQLAAAAWLEKKGQGAT